MSTNSSSTATASSGGLGLVGLSLIVMLVFRLAGEAGVSWGLTFSWWWFALPPILGIAWVLFWVVVVILIAAIVNK